MILQLRATIVLLAFLTLLCGAAYPLALYGTGHALMPTQAGGSLVSIDGRIVGSELIGQTFTSAKYFYSRPSAAGSGYDAASSGGSNLAPGAPSLFKSVAARAEDLQRNNDGIKIPVDMVTNSGSGLDPHISLAAANFQIDRIAEARNLPPQKVKSVINQNIEPRFLGLFGQVRVNVLKLNIDLDEQAKQAP